MILKQADSKAPQIEELQKLIQLAPATIKPRIEQELRILQAGMKGEKEAAYLIDFDLKDSQKTAIIHDLRLEVNGRVAQIDHLLIHRTMTFFVLETKHFHAGIKIDDDGQFLQWNSFKKTFEGMSSPLAQNERHITVLKDTVNTIEWPTRMGMKLSPVYEPFVLVSGNARIDRPKKFDTSRIIKAETLMAMVDKTLQDKGILATFGAAAKLVSTDTLISIGQALVGLHRPLAPDYASKFGLNNQPPPTIAAVAPVVEKTSPVDNGTNVCSKCGGIQLSVQYGKYGYYFKCSNCDGNSPIKLGCDRDGHKERLRKDGTRFYRECSNCGSSTLFFANS